MYDFHTMRLLYQLSYDGNPTILVYLGFVFNRMFGILLAQCEER